MAALGDVARVTFSDSDELTQLSDDQRDAWYLWRSVTEEAKRNRVSVTPDGYYMYRGALRPHVKRLWPTLDNEDRVALEKRIYAILRAHDLAVCVQRKDPPVWRVAMTWKLSDVKPIVNVFKMTRAEKRVTPEEAGETLAPGTVTVTKKEDQSMANIDPLREHHQKLQEERDTRREIILEMLNEYQQPLVVDEITHLLFDSDVSTIRKDLQFLVANGKVFSRRETAEERMTRFGGEKAYARKALLYSTTDPVPTRTARAVVDGYVAERADRVRAMRTPEINNRLYCKLSKMGSRARFTVQDLSGKTGVQREATRSRVVGLVEAGALKQSGYKDGARVFRVVDQDKLKAALHPDETLPERPEPQPHPELSLLERAGEILEDNKRLRDRVNKLKHELGARNAEVDTLRQQIAQLEQQLADATKPAMDPELVEQMMSWTPSSD